MTDAEKARAAVVCRRCQAAIGDPCHDSAGNAMLDSEGAEAVHPARLHDWQESQA